MVFSKNLATRFIPFTVFSVCLTAFYVLFVLQRYKENKKRANFLLFICTFLTLFKK